MTAIAYLLVPAILSIARKQLTKKQILTISIINGLCVCIIFMIIQIEAGVEEARPGGILWAFIGHWLMMKCCLKTAETQNTNAKKVVRVRVAHKKKPSLTNERLIIIILTILLLASIVFNVTQALEINKYKDKANSNSGMTFEEWTEKYYQ